MIFVKKKKKPKAQNNKIALSIFFQMSRIVLESKSPTWQKSDLRMTRVKDTDRGELLIFKELSWQTVRIEAKSTMSEDLTPLRLITNQARCRITIKKKLSGIYFFLREIIICKHKIVRLYTLISILYARI